MCFIVSPMLCFLSRFSTGAKCTAVWCISPCMLVPETRWHMFLSPQAAWVGMCVKKRRVPNQMKGCILIMKQLLFRCLPLLLVVVAVLFSTMTTEAASAKSVTAHSVCTPGSYHNVEPDTDIYDQGSGYPIGLLRWQADGCGWVWAQVWGQVEGAVVNHVQIFNSAGNLVVEAPYNGSSYNATIHVATNGDNYYAVGIVQVSSRGFWGSARSGPANGYTYL